MCLSKCRAQRAKGLCYLLFCFLGATLELLSSRAMSWDYTSPLIAFSRDRVYKVEVIPPLFTNTMSYDFFQSQEYWNLTLLEGADRAATAIARCNLHQMQNGEYKLLWSRPVVNSKIPIYAHILGSRPTNVLVILDGQRQGSGEGSSPFSMYNLRGIAVTNGTYFRGKSKDFVWDLEGNAVRLTRPNNILLQITVPPP
jgi:hypothetical protein